VFSTAYAIWLQLHAIVVTYAYVYIPGNLGIVELGTRELYSRD